MNIQFFVFIKITRLITQIFKEIKLMHNYADNIIHKEKCVYHECISSWILTTENNPAISSKVKRLLPKPQTCFLKHRLIRVYIVYTVCLYVWLLFCSALSVRSIHYVGHLYNFIRTTMKSGSINIIVCVFWWAYVWIPIEYYLKKDIAGLDELLE